MLFPKRIKLNLFPKARYIPELSFYDDAGKAYKLKDFKEYFTIYGERFAAKAKEIAR